MNAKLKSVSGSGGRANHTGKALRKLLNQRKRKQQAMPRQQRKILGRYIVADPKICHGKPTFIGTRIMVWQILRQLANGRSWDAIVGAWGGDVSKEAIAEAIALAGRTFEDHAVEYAEESQLA